MLEARTQFKRVSRGILQLIVGVYDEDGNLLSEELEPQQPIYWNFGLNIEEIIRKKNKELEEK